MTPPFQVIWSNDALTQLVAFWVPAANRLDITNAQHRIDQALAQDPKSAGRFLSEGLWKIHDPPLHVFYEINDVHNLVRVTDVDIK
jgi:hypothetical protein